MKKDYKYRLDKRSRIITAATITVIFAALATMYFKSASGFLPIWAVIILLTAAALYILSIPVKVRLTDDALEIRCLVEMTTIRIGDIKSIGKIDRKEIRRTVPLVGSYGFFGYYGYYYNFPEMTTFKVYISEWENLMRIETIYEETYIINCNNPAELTRLVNTARLSLAANKI